MDSLDGFLPGAVAALTAFSVSSPSTMIALGAWKLKIPGFFPPLHFCTLQEVLKSLRGKDKQENPARLVRHFIRYSLFFSCWLASWATTGI